MPTLVDFAGAEYPDGFKCDGLSLKPFVTGTTDKHKDIIHACIGTTQLLRTRTHMIEVVTPVLAVLNNDYIGLKADHPFFQEKGGKWLESYMKPNAVAKHLHNHKDYVRYDETMDGTRD